MGYETSEETKQNENELTDTDNRLEVTRGKRE